MNIMPHKSQKFLNFYVDKQNQFDYFDKHPSYDP